MSFDIFDDGFDFQDAFDLAGAIGVAQEKCEEEKMLIKLLGTDDEDESD